ncbi:hypothetical protein K9U39_09605 [Rhodoblastus acidophilus]|uniref:Uncharacterized protein n=1 Tax=Candidatus Rhodoblastus alkanivorans TaxID=2954117 RepID=A0ABS9Z8E7_9HYPH|nr:hypothetical protein [Candidatus Rhodoblastus alkanivorans]MCI4677982.1 hypothetical protein [Candidatus Rhodoblastus alkanivorans]MCI4683877.1 hypothetical protein [Candidatus Rhodoblastus alkanivorans]MDI4641195.1 hypothetical protein [Rhodoblastus acidophilus]
MAAILNEVERPPNISFSSAFAKGVFIARRRLYHSCREQAEFVEPGCLSAGISEEFRRGRGTRRGVFRAFICAFASFTS